MPGRVLVLAPAADRGAAGVAAALAGLLPGNRWAWITAEAIEAAALSWRLAGSAAEAVLRLPGGTRLAPEAADVLLDRLPPANPPAFAAARAEDRAYALGEAAAIRHAWLAALPARVVNPPLAIAGWADPGPLPWLHLAARARLPARRAVAACPGREAGRAPDMLATEIDGARWGSVHPAATAALLPGSVPQLQLERLGPPVRTVLVCAGRVLGEVPEPIRAGCLRLAEEAGASLLEAGFGVGTDGAPRLGRASLRPALARPEEAGFVAQCLAALAA